MLECISIHDPYFQKYRREPLLIAGPGPGWDLFDFSKTGDAHVFALNSAITELWSNPRTWWVSNDHDRTFGSSHVNKIVPPQLKEWKTWRTITQKLFIPGELGNFNWVDHKNIPKGPLKWRLPAPDGSTIAYYVAGPNMTGHLEWVYNGSSVFELALEVATLWGFSPIVVVGCDMTMVDEKQYYAKPFRNKETPRRMRSGAKMTHHRDEIVRNRGRWSRSIAIVSDLWIDPPFEQISAEDAAALLRRGEPWNPP